MYINWDNLVQSAARLVPPGPQIKRSEGIATVRMLHGAREAAASLVTVITGLEQVQELTAQAQLLVLDRPSWIKVTGHSIGKILQESTPTPGAALNSTALNSTALKTEIVSILTGISIVRGAIKLPGSFNPYITKYGQIAAIAPNVFQIERKLDFDAFDYSKWVLASQLIYASQFAAAPWLKDRVQATLASLWNDFELAEYTFRAPSGATSEGDNLSTEADSDLSNDMTTVSSAQLRQSLRLFALQEAYVRVTLSKITPLQLSAARSIQNKLSQECFGSLLLRFILPTLAQQKFNLYRQQSASFVRAVISEAGYEGLNKIWINPDFLPEDAELQSPKTWIARVI